MQERMDSMERHTAESLRKIFDACNKEGGNVELLKRVKPILEKKETEELSVKE